MITPIRGRKLSFSITNKLYLPRLEMITPIRGRKRIGEVQIIAIKKEQRLEMITPIRERKPAMYEYKYY